MVALKYQLPRKWRSVALNSSPIVYLLKSDIIKINTGHNCVYRIDLAGRSKAENMAVKQADKVLPVYSIIGLPTYMKRSAKTNMAE